MLKMIFGNYAESNLRILTLIALLLLLYFEVILPIMIIYGLLLVFEISKVVFSFVYRRKHKQEIETAITELEKLVQQKLEEERK